MDAVHFHLILNHFPILGLLFGIILVLFGIILKKSPMEKIGLLTLVIVALLTIPAYLSGNQAEDRIEKLPHVSTYYLEEHEDIAQLALTAMLSTGGIALITLLLSRFENKQFNWLRYLTVILATATFGIMIKVGNYGGKIIHGEIRNETIQQSDQGMEVNKESDDDD